MLATGRRAEVSMEYYEVSPVSQRIAWLNGQHMKMTAGLTALSWALGCLYDSRHPQVVWQPGCSVKLDRPKVNRIKGHTSHIHPVACPAAVTTAVQTGTYLAFYLENFNTVDQCVLELEGLWRVHKETEDDLDHSNKIWVVRMDTTETHDLQSFQPKAQDIFNDLSLLAPDFFTTRRSSKTQRSSPTKNRSRSGQHKKSPSYKINSSRRRSHKRSLTPVTASRIMQQAITQCQQNLQDAEAQGVTHCQAERSPSTRSVVAEARLSCISSATEGDESWSNAEDEHWGKIKRTTSIDIENVMSDGDDAHWSEGEDWSEFGGDSWSDVNETKKDKPRKGFHNHVNENCIQELQLSDNTHGNQGFLRANLENCPSICEDRTGNVKAININRGNVSDELEDSNDETIKRTIRFYDSTESHLKQRLGRISTSTPVPQDSPKKVSSQSQQISRDGNSYDVNAGRNIADSIKKVHESLVDTHRQCQSFDSQSSIAHNPIHFGTSRSSGKSPEKRTEIDNTTTIVDRTAEPTFTKMEGSHKRMLVDLSKHEVVGTWLYSSDEEDDYDDDEGIYKKEEAFFRVDVTELLHELAYVQQRRYSPNLTIENKMPAPEEDEGSFELAASNEWSLEEMKTAHIVNSESNEPSQVQLKLGKCGHFDGEILREVQPKIANIFDARIQADTVTRHELEKGIIKERCPHNFQSEDWSTMVEGAPLKITRNVSSSENGASARKWSHENLNNTGQQSEAHQSSQHARLAYSKTQRTEAEENKENSMSPEYQANENKFNLRNMVKQFEALSSNDPRSEKQISGTSTRGHGSLFSQRTEAVGGESRQEVRMQFEKSATNFERRPTEPHVCFSPNQFFDGTATLETVSTKFSSSGNSKNNEEKKIRQDLSVDSEFRSPISRSTQATNVIQTSKLPLATEAKAENKHNGQYGTDHRNPPQFGLLSNASSPSSKNKSAPTFLGKHHSKSESNRTITLRNESSSRGTATEFRTNSPTGPAAELRENSTKKGRSESLSLTCLTKHDPPQRSASVTPSPHSQSLSSLLEPDHHDASPRQYNSDSTVSLEETFERLDQTDKRSPKSKHSVFMVKKQSCKSREQRILLPGIPQNSIKMNYDSEQIQDTEQHTEQVHSSTDTLPRKAYPELEPKPSTNVQSLQFRAEEAFGSRNKETTVVGPRHEELPRDNRNTEGGLVSKPWTDRGPESNEFHGDRSRAAEMAPEALEKSVPESALVVFRLQPSAPHQAWQFKKAILKVHHRDHSKKREDKTTLRRNAHLLRKRR